MNQTEIKAPNANAKAYVQEVIKSALKWHSKAPEVAAIERLQSISCSLVLSRPFGGEMDAETQANSDYYSAVATAIHYGRLRIR